MKIISSKKFRVNLRDFLQALLISVLTPVFVILQNSLDQGQLTFNYKQMAMAALAGGISYLVKKFFSAEKVIIKNPTSLQKEIQNNENI